MLMPMLDESIELAAAMGAHEVVIGMAHRGRLNVLVHTIGHPYGSVLREFEGERTIDAVVIDEEGGTGDVKYHLRRTGTRTTRTGEVTVSLAPNPSHLEAVDPVVEGWTRAEQTDRSTARRDSRPVRRAPDPDPRRRVVRRPGRRRRDAQSLDAWTATRRAARCTSSRTTRSASRPIPRRAARRATRATSPRASTSRSSTSTRTTPRRPISAVRLALAYRQELRPRRRHRPRRLPALRPQRAGRGGLHAAAHGRADRGASDRAASSTSRGSSGRACSPRPRPTPSSSETQAELRAAHEELQASIAPASARARTAPCPADTGEVVETAVPAERLATLNEQLLECRRTSTVHPKLAQAARAAAHRSRDGGDRLGPRRVARFRQPARRTGSRSGSTGQDTERGTFAHRHARPPRPRSGELHVPLQHLPEAGAAFEVYNSPLSEYACLGFEYGYSVAAPESLVLWEAQFGDFVNGAQIVIDQFLVAGLSKWQQSSRLTLLLPHGYEGNGPEHSSAKLERFLQLAAQENIRVANCTTRGAVLPSAPAPGPRRDAAAARRDDAEGPPAADGRPPRRSASSPTAASSRSSTIPSIQDRAEVRRLVLCSGKVYYDLVGHEQHDRATGVAVARIEQLYPFPAEAASALTASYPRPGGARLGAGGAAEHGRVADRSATGSRRRRRPACRSGSSAARGARARARATRRRTCSSRTGSPASRSPARGLL